MGYIGWISSLNIRDGRPFILACMGKMDRTVTLTCIGNKILKGTGISLYFFKMGYQGWNN
jgi:hypothetical protein